MRSQIDIEFNGRLLVNRFYISVRLTALGVLTVRFDIVEIEALCVIFRQCMLLNEINESYTTNKSDLAKLFCNIYTVCTLLLNKNLCMFICTYDAI